MYYEKYISSLSSTRIFCTLEDALQLWEKSFSFSSMSAADGDINYFIVAG